MSHKAFGGALALAFGLTAGLAAQTGNPPQNPPHNPPAAPTAAQAASAGQSVTLEGCLVQEKDIPGRAPNVAEKAGVMEDYILTSAKFLKGVPHAPGATGAAAEQPTGTSGMGAAKAMFEVRGIEDTQLKSFIGQRVEIEGRVNPADFAERKTSGEKAGDLPELHGVVIRKATSTEPCPAK